MSAGINSNFVLGSYAPISEKREKKLLAQIAEIDDRIGRESSSGIGDIVVIGHRILKQQHIIDNFGLFSTSGTKFSRKNADLIASNVSGCIFGSTPWSLAVNDYFILSCVRVNKVFHITGKSVSDLREDELWDSEKKHPTVFARELIFILKSGYRCIQPPYDVGMTLVPPKINNKLTEKQSAVFWGHIDSLFSFEDVKKTVESLI